MKMKSLKIGSLLFLTLLFVFSSHAQTNENLNKNEKTENKKELEKNTNQVDNDDCPESGVVRLRVTFDKSGKATNVEIVSSAGCSSFDEQASKAAKKIKFKPTKKDRKKNTIIKLVEYTFQKSN